MQSNTFIWMHGARFSLQPLLFQKDVAVHHALATVAISTVAPFSRGISPLIIQ